MAKKTVNVYEHKDSLVRQELSEEEFGKLQPGIQQKYKKVGSKEVQDTPEEVANAKK